MTGMTGDDVRQSIDDIRAALKTNREAQPLFQACEKALPLQVQALAMFFPPETMDPYIKLASGLLAVEKDMREELDANLCQILAAVYSHPIITNLVARWFLSKDDTLVGAYGIHHDPAFQKGLTEAMVSLNIETTDEDQRGLSGIALDVLQGRDTWIKRRIVHRMQERAVRVLGVPLDQISWPDITPDQWLRIIGIILSILSLLMML